MKFSFSFHKNEKRPNGTLQSVKKVIIYNFYAFVRQHA